MDAVHGLRTIGLILATITACQASQRTSALGTFDGASGDSGSGTGGASGGGSAGGSGGGSPIDAAVEASSAPSDPLPPGQWKLVWQDDFVGVDVDSSNWTTYSDSYSDECRGNHPDHKLEYNLPQNLSLDGTSEGLLTIEARKETYQAASGEVYSWTSGLITTGHACGHDPSSGVTVQKGDYISQRAKLSDALGTWPALWTWPDEVDVYEYHPDNPTLLELTNHTGSGAGYYYDAGFDLSLDWHYFGVYLGDNGVDWYLDGTKIFGDSVGFQSDGASIIVDLAIADGSYHPAPSASSAKLLVDSVRVFRAQ
jgi:hypothetical protein